MKRKGRKRRYLMFAQGIERGQSNLLSQTLIRFPAHSLALFLEPLSNTADSLSNTLTRPPSRADSLSHTLRRFLSLGIDTSDSLSHVLTRFLSP